MRAGKQGRQNSTGIPEKKTGRWRTWAGIAALSVLCAAATVTPAAAASTFTDVPASHWAAGVIGELQALGFSDGIGNNQFGLGQTITRAQFAAFLSKQMGYGGDAPQAYRDNTDSNAWYYGAVNAMAANGVTSPTGAFRPNDPITRAEMTEMMVGALGFYDLGKQLNRVSCPFQDVQERRGYIALANSMGIAGGMDASHFAPDATATREQAAAMLVRLYHKQEAQLDELLGFYAISSSSQRSFLSQLDSAAFGWARLTLADGQAVLNTTASQGNEYCIPAGYQEPVQQARQGGCQALLSVYGDNGSGQLGQLLANPTLRQQAIGQIVAALQQEQATFDGVVMDLELLRKGQKDDYTAFLTELRRALGSRPLYVAVHPVTSQGAYYDGYDYAAIGRLADRVILMAYDYAANSLTAQEMAQGYTQTPLSPLNEVYVAIRACLNGGIDADKLLLGISMDTVQWKLQQGAVIHSTPYHPAYSAVQTRLASGCTVSYPNYSYNPYASYTDSRDNTQNILWFENQDSVADKAELARLMGLQGLSIWRLGTIPTDSSTNLHIWSELVKATQ